MRFGDYEVDLARFELRRAGTRVRVQPRVLDLLVYLMRHHERVVPKDELLDAVWQGVAVSEAALTQAVKDARRVVRDDGRRQAVIQTVRGRGYRFVAPLVQEETGLGGSGEPFVGRQPVLELLEGELAAARAGRGRAVLLTGEPGIGKSRTALEFARTARDEGAAVLTGHCLEGQGAPALWVWSQIVRSVLRQGLLDPRSLPRDGLAVLVQGLPDLRAELGGGEALPPRLSDDQARFRFFDEVCRLLQGVAESQPLVLVIDDLHWADQSSLHLLEFVLREIRESAVLVLGTFREAELARDPARARLLGSVSRSAHSVRLEGLTSADVAALLEQVLGRPVAVSNAEAIHDRTGGNPFFLNQILQLWQAGADFDPEDLRKELPLPQGVREAIGRHLDVLPEACRDLLSRASVIGRSFELDVLAHVSGVAIDSVLETLENALAARVVRTRGESWTRFEFSHALIPETLYEAMSAARRVRLHARVAQALEKLRGEDPARFSEIAHHYLQAAPLGEVGPAVHFAAKAAELATRQLAYAEAVLHYQQALDALQMAPGREAGRLELLLALGEAQVRVGDVADARKTFRTAAGLARERGDAAGLARAALGLDWDIVRQGEVGTDAVRLALLGEALGAVGPAESPLRVRLLAALDEALYFENEGQPGPSLSREAVEMARRLDDPDALVFALNRRHLLLRRPECLQERLSVSTELVQLAQRRQDPDLVFDAHGSQLHDALEHGDAELVDETLDTFERLAPEYRIPKYLWYAALYRAMRELMTGRFVEAEEQIARAWSIGGRVQSDLARLWRVVQMQALRLDQGRAAEFLPELRAVSELYPMDVIRINLAYVEALTGFTGPARRVLEEAISGGLAGLRRDISWILSVTTLGTLSELVGDAKAAAAVYDRLLPFARQHIVIGTSVVYRGSVAHELGRLATVLGRFDEAESHLASALERERAVGAQPFEAGVLCTWGRMLLARGDRELARRRLAESVKVAAEVGAAAHVQRATELLAAAEA